LIWLSWIGTAVFVLTASGATVSPSTLDIPALVVALALFFAGLGGFALAYFVAVGRSRHDEIAITGLFFLSGSAPRRVRRQLFGALGAEVVVALVTVAIRPFTSLAFGTLVPLYGLALAGLWAARHGTFPPRSAADPW
jgi:hypothetical protein